MDCGPTCLRIIAKYHGRHIDLPRLRELSGTTREGSNLSNLATAASRIGFKTMGVKVDFDQLSLAPLPCIVHWKQSHFVVLHKIGNDKIHVVDPGIGRVQFPKDEFLAHWIGEGSQQAKATGVALLLEPTDSLKDADPRDQGRKKRGFAFLFRYLLTYKKYLFQLIISLIATSLIQLIFPFITQNVIDVGVRNKDMNFVYLLLFAQLGLFLGKTTVRLIRSWMLLHLSTRINITLVSDFFIKLMKLPISYFDKKMTGDILQRIHDHRRIEKLLTDTSLNVLFSTINLFLFGGILAYYNVKIFFIFLLGSVCYLGWILLFLKRRRKIDYARFSEVGEEKSKLIELINGMQEIKLHNAERRMRWGWEDIQANLFKIEIKNLSLKQTQNIGAEFINEGKNILITFLAASLVISGDLTLGMMLSITYIIGQLNGPMLHLVSFMHSVQDTRISIERLGEIHNREDEEPAGEVKTVNVDFGDSLALEGIDFCYPGEKANVLNQLKLVIPGKKITAIVGASGSGKTTLMKLLLKFYEPTEGNMSLGGQELKQISQKKWRESSGVVMQEGFIFNDTIANNIAFGKEVVDQEMVEKAAHIANIDRYIDGLPLGYNTRIGMEGKGLSTGQKQRILIARAVYKNPEILFFDEATSALDANNERIIVERLNHFFKDRTVLIIAHRLSTVKNADQIVVLDRGKIIESGNHQELVHLQGAYHRLVKDQLALENLSRTNSSAL